MEKNIVRLNEEQLQQIVTESVTRYLKESVEKGEIDERFLGNLRDKLGAVKDTVTKGGNYAAHFNNRQLQGARSDIENLKGKYGVQNGQNGSQYVKQNSQAAIDKINAKYDQKIQALDKGKQKSPKQQVRPKNNGINTKLRKVLLTKQENKHIKAEEQQ